MTVYLIHVYVGEVVSILFRDIVVNASHLTPELGVKQD